MGLVDIIKPLSTVLSSAVNKYKQNQDKKSWECRESNPVLLDTKQVCHLHTMQPPMLSNMLDFVLNVLPRLVRSRIEISEGIIEEVGRSRN